MTKRKVRKVQSVPRAKVLAEMNPELYTKPAVEPEDARDIYKISLEEGEIALKKCLPTIYNNQVIQGFFQNGDGDILILIDGTRTRAYGRPWQERKNLKWNDRHGDRAKAYARVQRANLPINIKELILNCILKYNYKGTASQIFRNARNKAIEILQIERMAQMGYGLELTQSEARELGYIR